MHLWVMLVAVASCCFKVAGDCIFVSMQLFKEYARSAKTNGDNTRNIQEKVSGSIIASDSNRVAHNSCAFQVFNQNQ